MKEKTRVIVYGSSLNMAGVAVSLKAGSGLEVVCLDPHAHNSRQYLSELNPTAVAFDLNDPPSDVDIRLLREKPGVMLIGVDPDSNEMLVFSSRPQQALSMSDLVSFLRELSSSRTTDMPELGKELTHE